MMKMATGDGFPLRQGAETGLDWFSVATEACGGGTPDLGYVLEVWVYKRGVGVGKKSGGSPRRPRGRGVRPGGRARPHPHGQGVAPLVKFLRSMFFYIFGKHHP